MTKSDFSRTLLVEQSPEEVFASINKVRGWWIDEIEGSSDKLNDEFAVRFADIHYSKQKLVELVPNTKVTWLITESKLNFLKKKNEWTDTRISFEISKEGNKTKLRFTHSGLVPDIECYRDCSLAWSEYLDSLQKLITTGHGNPFKKNK